LFRVGGIKAQIEDGKTGYLVDPQNNYQVAQKIEYLILHPSACQEISRSARESVRENFLLPRMMYNHLLLFQELERIKYEECSSDSVSSSENTPQS
jgi:trehalose synthase